MVQLLPKLVATAGENHSKMEKIQQPWKIRRYLLTLTVVSLMTTHPSGKAKRMTGVSHPTVGPSGTP